MSVVICDLTNVLCNSQNGLENCNLYALAFGIGMAAVGSKSGFKQQRSQIASLRKQLHDAHIVMNMQQGSNRLFKQVAFSDNVTRNNGVQSGASNTAAEILMLLRSEHFPEHSCTLVCFGCSFIDGFAMRYFRGRCSIVSCPQSTVALIDNAYMCSTLKTNTMRMWLGAESLADKAVGAML